MPLQASSTYDSLHKLLDEAYERTMADPSDPDPEIDLQGREAPQWGHHSFRRFADTVARTTRGETGATEQDIDIIFGWLEAMCIHIRCSCTTRLSFYASCGAALRGWSRHLPARCLLGVFPSVRFPGSLAPDRFSASLVLE